MKCLYESILSNDLENELDDLVEIGDIDDLFGCTDWGQIKSFKNNNLILDVSIDDPKEIHINDYLARHKLKSIDFGGAEICIHYEGKGLKNINLKSKRLDFRYKSECELKNVRLDADQITFGMYVAGIKLNKCTLNAKTIRCEYSYLNTTHSIINTQRLIMNIPIHPLRGTNKLKKFITTVDLMDFDNGSLKIRDNHQIEQHQKLLMTINPMDALGFRGKIDEIIIKPAMWLPGIVIEKSKPSRNNYFEMAGGWYIYTD